MVMVIVGVIAAVIVIVAVVAVIFVCVRRKSSEKPVNGIGNFENPVFTGHADFVMSPTRPEVEEYDQIPADRVMVFKQNILVLNVVLRSSFYLQVLYKCLHLH
jgi:hypothetical protein